jgi:protein subunit release factor B
VSKKLFTITTADLREERYRGSGAGGQNRNKRDTGVRFTHEPSGAVGESEEQRSQLQNRQSAFRKMANSPRFIMWAKAQGQARIEGHASLDRKINELMADENLRIEVIDACAPHESFCDAPKRLP